MRCPSKPAAVLWPLLLLLVSHSDRGLQGELPAFLDLVALRAFRMPNNSLTGPLPEEWSTLSLLETVDLRWNNISGELPASWSDLPSLRNMYLNNNAIEGTLPKAWWLGKFVVLALANNRIGGSLPLNWKNMEHIEVIDLSHNRLTGILPAEWSTLTRLKILLLNDNALYGPLPETWGDLEGMEDLRLGNNNLVGELPPNWSFLLNAVIMSLRDNNLGGFIPEKWTGLSRTCRMDLSNNPFVCNLPPQGALLAKEEGPGLVLIGTNTGRCPSFSSVDTQALLQFKAEVAFMTGGDVLEDWKWKSNSACADGWTGVKYKLSEMSALETVKLDGNSFDGTLPESWGKILTLKHLNLSSNAIGGVLPPEWKSLEDLEELDISRNLLFGELPSEWSNLRNLRVLNGYNNTLEGQLPYSWSALTHMTHVHLQNNILTGALPVTWKTFRVLREIDLSGNQLKGPVPAAWQSMKKLKVLNLEGNEELCGGIPSSLPVQNAPTTEALSTPCADYLTEAILLVEFRAEVEDPSQRLTLWKVDAPPCLGNREAWPELSGTLPDFLIDLSMIEDLRLGENQFTGPLPPSWAEFFRLTHLNLSTNALTGTLPSEWSTLVSLVHLDLSGNNFDSSFPEEWSQMLRLEHLNVSQNVHLCGGLPKDLAQSVSVISDNSTFFDSCSHHGDSSWTIPVVSILLSVFIMISLFIWISCFCCCCYQRKKQRGKLLEMMSTSLSKNREAHNNEMNAHSGGNLEALADNGPSMSSRSGRSGYSPAHRFPAGHEMPPLAAHVPKTVHPYYPAPSWTRPRNATPAARPPPPSERRSRGGSRSGSPPVAPGRVLQHMPMPSYGEPSTVRTPAAFGSMQSVPVAAASYDDQPAVATRTPRTPPPRAYQRSPTELEMCRTHMQPPATPTDVQTAVMRVRSTTPPSGPMIDPRKRASRIPRHPTPSVASSVQPGSSTNRSIADRSVYSERRPSSQVAPSPTSSHRISFVPSDLGASDRERSPGVEPSMPSTSVGPHGERNEDGWQYETTIQLPTTPKDASSPTAEMFRWLESCYQSGTFDLDDIPREILSKAAQHRGAVANAASSPQRTIPVTSASVSHGLDTSTNELLIWLESRIEEVKSTELNRARRRVYPTRAEWTQVDSTDATLFNYKTSSTINNDEDDDDV